MTWLLLGGVLLGVAWGIHHTFAWDWRRRELTTVDRLRRLPK
jgi:hypothetical protein